MFLRDLSSIAFRESYFAHGRVIIEYGLNVCMYIHREGVGIGTGAVPKERFQVIRQLSLQAKPNFDI